MKKYLLLRNERESGPYSMEQLTAAGLLPSDRVWIIDESTSWMFPEEIKELLPLLKQHSRTSPLVPDETKHEKPAKESKEQHSTLYTPNWKKRYYSVMAAGLLATCIGMLLAIVVIRKMVRNYIPGTQAVAIAPVLDREPTPKANENFQNALLTEIVPLYQNVLSKTSKHSNDKKQQSQKSSVCKVGLFSGINGLQLTVFNTSDQFADRVIVAVDYLTPGGSLIQSEDVLFSAIMPKGAQTIGIPGSGHGVKISYRILKVYTHNYKADVKEV